MQQRHYPKIASTIAGWCIIIVMFFVGCSLKPFKEITSDTRGRQKPEVVGYGYARIPSNARSNQITLAKHRARMVASKNLAVQIYGIRFFYDKRKKQSVTLKKFQTETRGSIKGAITEYYFNGNANF